MVSRFAFNILLSYIFIASHSFAQEIEEVVVTAPLGGNFAIQQYGSEEFQNSFRIQETSPGMESPYLGPFTGNQVDQHINGVRFSNSYFRSGPNQYWGWIPSEFTDQVIVSDGGNVGGSLNRIVGVPEDSIAVSYNTAISATTATVSRRFENFSLSYNDVDTGNVDTADGKIPNSAYNRQAAIAEYVWDSNSQTMFIYSRSDDLRRTDKWNGGVRITGPRDGQVYNYELQELAMLVHNYTSDKLSVDLSYQEFSEHVLNKTKRIEVDLNISSVNVSYDLNDYLTLYSSNQLEAVYYETVDVSSTSDDYNTYKFGVRSEKSFGDYNVRLSAGYKTVTITDLSNFESPEYSLIVDNGLYFISYDVTTNAPSYTSVKKDKTTGRGTVIPNNNLDQEYAETWRVGLQQGSLYFDVYFKHLQDAYDQITIAEDTFQIVNGGWVKAYGATFGYQSNNFLESGISINTRVELVKATKSISGTTDTEPTSKTAPMNAFLTLSKNDYFVEVSYQPKDRDLAFKDKDDVRIFEHNDGLLEFNLGKKGMVTKDFQYTVMINNVFDNDGRVLGSSVDVPTRGIYLELKYLNF